jgi:hypothetical protein
LPEERETSAGRPSPPITPYTINHAIPSLTNEPTMPWTPRYTPNGGLACGMPCATADVEYTVMGADAGSRAEQFVVPAQFSVVVK